MTNLELMDTYIKLIDIQDEVISELGRIIQRQENALEQIRVTRQIEQKDFELDRCKDSLALSMEKYKRLMKAIE